MTTRTPDPADPYEEAGLPATDDALPGKLITDDVQDDVVMPTDHASYVTSYGTTDLEAELGEPLGASASQRRSRTSLPARRALDRERRRDETPIRATARNGSAGWWRRTRAPTPTTTPTLYAEDRGTDSGDFSAEESAMHVEPDSG